MKAYRLRHIQWCSVFARALLLTEGTHEELDLTPEGHSGLVIAGTDPLPLSNLVKSTSVNVSARAPLKSRCCLQICSFLQFILDCWCLLSTTVDEEVKKKKRKVWSCLDVHIVLVLAGLKRPVADIPACSNTVEIWCSFNQMNLKDILNSSVLPETQPAWLCFRKHAETQRVNIHLSSAKGPN